MIETIRLILRPFTEQDISFSQAFMLPEFMVNSPQGAYTEEAAKSRIIEMSEGYRKSGFGKLAVIEKESNSIIGYCGLEPCVIEGKSEIELGYRLLTKFRGKGYATEAALALVEFEAIKGNSNIIAFTEYENFPSMRVLVKLGFSELGQSVYSGMKVRLFRKIM